MATENTDRTHALGRFDHTADAFDGQAGFMDAAAVIGPGNWRFTYDPYAQGGAPASVLWTSENPPEQGVVTNNDATGFEFMAVVGNNVVHFLALRLPSDAAVIQI